MKRKGFITITAFALSAAMLFGCSKPAAGTSAPETTAVAETAAEEKEESTIAPPFLSNLEKYDSVISKLSENDYYAFADICKDYDVLVVTDGVYDHGEGIMAAIHATLYGLDKDGKVFEFGIVSSEGTAYPLAVYDGCLMFGGNHHVGKVFTDGSNLITKMDAEETFDESGKAKYFVFDLDEKFEGEVEDNTKLVQLYDEYEKAVVLNFTKPGAGESADELTVMGNTVMSPDGWKLTYDPEKFCLNDTLGGGEVAFNYTGECAGTTAVFLSYVPDKMPDEALYEKVAGYSDDLVERFEARFGDYWAHYRVIAPDDKAAGSECHSYIGIEHNGGTVILEQIDHTNVEPEQNYSDIINAFSELLSTFELLNHEPQAEYAYVAGSYAHTYTDELEGQKVEATYRVVMNDDHTCMFSIQDDIAGEWTGTELILNSGNSYEYTVEGDSLYVDMDGNWTEFNRE